MKLSAIDANALPGREVVLLERLHLSTRKLIEVPGSKYLSHLTLTLRVRRRYITKSMANYTVTTAALNPYRA